MKLAHLVSLEIEAKEIAIATSHPYLPTLERLEPNKDPQSSQRTAALSRAAKQVVKVDFY